MSPQEDRNEVDDVGDVEAAPDSPPARPVDVMHGMTLEAIIVSLVETFGWEELGYRIRINCFVDNPSVKSSLKFLRKTPWARSKVEALYRSTKSDSANL